MEALPEPNPSPAPPPNFWALAGLTPMKSRSEGKFIVSAPIVLKSGDGGFSTGDDTKKKDMYVQQSVQDYYIKFCESSVTREEMEKALKKENWRLFKRFFVDFLNFHNH